MEYILIMQNGEVMSGVTYVDFESACEGLEEYEAEYVVLREGNELEIVE